MRVPLKEMDWILLEMLKKFKATGNLPPHEERAFLEKYWEKASDVYKTISVELKSGVTTEYVTLDKHVNRLTLPPTAIVLEIRFMGKKVPEHMVRIQQYYMEDKRKDMRLVEKKCDENGCSFKWYVRLVGEGHVFKLANPDEIVDYARRHMVPVWSTYSKILKVLYDVDEKKGRKAYGTFYIMGNPHRLMVVVRELESHGLRPLALTTYTATYPVICERPISPAIVAYKDWGRLSELERMLIETHLAHRLEKIDKDIARAWDTLPFPKRLMMLESIWDLLTDTLKKNYVTVEVPILADKLARMLLEKEYRYYEEEVKKGLRPIPPISYGMWIYGKITIFFETTTYVPKYVMNLLLSTRKEDQARGVVELARIDPYITWRHIKDIVESMHRRLLVSARELDGKVVGDHAVVFTRRFPADLYGSLKPVVVTPEMARLIELMRKPPEIRFDVILNPAKLAKTRWEELTRKEQELVVKALDKARHVLPERARKFIDIKFYALAWNILQPSTRARIAQILTSMLSGKPSSKVKEEAERIMSERKQPPLKPDASLCEWEEYIMGKRLLCKHYENIGVRTIGDYLKVMVAYMKTYYDLGFIKRARWTIKGFIDILLMDAMRKLLFSTSILNGAYETWFLLEILRRVYSNEYDTNFIDLALGVITTPKRWERGEVKLAKPPEPLVNAFTDEDWKKILALVYTRVKF